MRNPRTLVQADREPNGEIRYYWSDGWVTVATGPGRWELERIPQPEEVDPDYCPPAEPTLNRELAPDVGGDDD